MILLGAASLGPGPGVRGTGQPFSAVIDAEETNVKANHFRIERETVIILGAAWAAGEYSRRREPLSSRHRRPPGTRYNGKQT